MIGDRPAYSNRVLSTLFEDQLQTTTAAEPRRFRSKVDHSFKGLIKRVPCVLKFRRDKSFLLIDWVSPEDSGDQARAPENSTSLKTEIAFDGSTVRGTGPAS